MAQKAYILLAGPKATSLLQVQVNPTTCRSVADLFHESFGGTSTEGLQVRGSWNTFHVIHVNRELPATNHLFPADLLSSAALLADLVYSTRFDRVLLTV